MAEKVDYAALKKGGFMRQKQKGCFSLRIAVVGGNLTAENIKTVAEVSEKYGHGYVHITSRQGIEIPFIKVEDINVVKEELAKGGVGTGVCGPRVRTVTACQGSEICPSGCIDTYTLAKELDARYFGMRASAQVQVWCHRLSEQLLKGRGKRCRNQRRHDSRVQP